MKTHSNYDLLKRSKRFPKEACSESELLQQSYDIASKTNWQKVIKNIPNKVAKKNKLK